MEESGLFREVFSQSYSSSDYKLYQYFQHAHNDSFRLGSMFEEDLESINIGECVNG